MTRMNTKDIISFREIRVKNRKEKGQASKSQVKTLWWFVMMPRPWAPPLVEVKKSGVRSLSFKRPNTLFNGYSKSRAFHGNL